MKQALIILFLICGTTLFSQIKQNSLYNYNYELGKSYKFYNKNIELTVNLDEKGNAVVRRKYTNDIYEDNTIIFYDHKDFKISDDLNSLELIPINEKVLEKYWIIFFESGEEVIHLRDHNGTIKVICICEHMSSDGGNGRCDLSYSRQAQIGQPDVIQVSCSAVAPCTQCKTKRDKVSNYLIIKAESVQIAEK